MTVRAPASSSSSAGAFLVAMAASFTLIKSRQLVLTRGRRSDTSQAMPVAQHLCTVSE
jgi:hypothetical protein